MLYKFTAYAVAYGGIYKGYYSYLLFLNFCGFERFDDGDKNVFIVIASLWPDLA